MNEIIELLEEKNRCLERFYLLNESELIRFTEGDFNQLESFYASREGILDMVHRVDSMIEESNQIPLDVSQISSSYKKEVLNLLNQKNELVTRILSQDLQVLSCIEDAKSGIIKELQKVKTTRRALGSYKSGEVRHRLNEKA